MNPKKIIVVGGGTAGWMSAHILAFSLSHHNFEISLIESPDIQPIGVGEGSTPALKLFFDKMGISEQEWMPACNATYKCGITFKGWSTKPGFEEYFHPFESPLDAQTLPWFTHNVHARLKGMNVEARPSRFFLSAYLAKHNLAPVTSNNFPLTLPYGYHFDSHLVGQLLKDKGIERGIGLITDTIIDATLQEDGSINQLIAKEGNTYEADLYVDCTGFSSLLSQKTLKTPYCSYSSELFNDSAIAMPTKVGPCIPSQTVSTALNNGWAWNIPLLNRFGNGYVYSSNYCSSEQAETEFRQYLGLGDNDVEARHLKMKVGRVEKSWNKNVLAVGLSQGFIEPLEATALHLIQQTVSLFAHLYSQGNFSNEQEAVFNKSINQNFDRTKDYIVAHYQTNSRIDTEYWRDNRNNREHTSQSLLDIYQCWSEGKELGAEVLRQKIEGFYPVSSWYCLMAGMGLFADDSNLTPPKPGDDSYSLAQVDTFLKQCGKHFKLQKAVLKSYSA